MPCSLENSVCHALGKKRSKRKQFILLTTFSVKSLSKVLERILFFRFRSCVVASDLKCKFRFSTIYFITISTLKFMPERIISRGYTKCGQETNKKYKIKISDELFYWGQPKYCITAACFSYSYSFFVLFQAIALLNNHNNKYWTCDSAKVATSMRYSKCLQENCLLFRSIFLWCRVFLSFHSHLCGAHIRWKRKKPSTSI